jgi:hypothetical protein
MLMTNADSRPFPSTLSFPDVDSTILEAEEDAEMDMLTQQGPWQTYMHHVLQAEACR